ncbi:MAG: hypothetical protein ACRC5C_11480 [Bacilli bacterium]
MSLISGAKAFAKEAKPASWAGVVMTGGSVAMNLAQGDNIGTVGVKMAADAAFSAVAPGPATALFAASLGKDIAVASTKFGIQKNMWWNQQYSYQNTIGRGFNDTQAAQTMRQAAIQAIQGSKMNARSALGGEAKILNPYTTRRS